jgi:ATP-dependent phosphofructokinase / diphosphate-dependent phosphofructokinase
LRTSAAPSSAAPTAATRCVIPVQGAAGPAEQDRSAELVGLCRGRGFDALVMVGGDSSMEIAACLQRQGLPVVGVPKTIDNDLDATNQTFGFDTAAGFATECIDRLHTTADSQHRVMVVEVMGRYAGWIALQAGMAGGAHVILLPEIPFDLDVVAEAIGRRDAAGRRHAIVVAAEGAQPLGGERARLAPAGGGHAERLGGIGAWVEAQLARRTGKECRSVVLGHLLRGGSPSAFDRVVAARFGACAVRALARGDRHRAPGRCGGPQQAGAGRRRHGAHGARARHLLWRPDSLLGLPKHQDFGSILI